VAEVPSHTFESPETGPDELSSVSIVSLVTVQRSASLARRDLAALRSKRGVKCERKYGLTAPGEDVKVRITELPEPAPGVWAQRVRLQLSRKYGGEKFYFDLFWFCRGPVEVLLGAASMDTPFSASEEQRLLNLLLTRAQQQIP
jgi:hypothetical protein